MIQKFCIRNQEDRCIQCRDWAPARKRICPAFRIASKKWPELLEHLRVENARLTTENIDLLKRQEFLRAELVEANRLLFREDQQAQTRVN